MEYVGRAPAPPLDRFIDDIYRLTGVQGHRRMNVPPMPAAHLFFNLVGPTRLWDSDPSVPPAVLADGWFMDVWTRRFLLQYPTRVRVVRVHFKRAKPEGWPPEASCHFVGAVSAAIDKAQELAGERTVAVNAGDVGGQILGNTIRGAWEKRLNGSWEHDFALTYRRAG